MATDWHKVLEEVGEASVKVAEDATDWTDDWYSGCSGGPVITVPSNSSLGVYLRKHPGNWNTGWCARRSCGRTELRCPPAGGRPYRAELAQADFALGALTEAGARDLDISEPASVQNRKTFEYRNLFRFRWENGQHIRERVPFASA